MFFSSCMSMCAIIWFGVKCHGQSGPITWNPIFLWLNACGRDGYSVCIYLLTRHGEFYIREDMPGSCLCLMRQRSWRWAYYANQTLRPCLISQSFHLKNLLSGIWEAISSVSSSTCTTEDGWTCRTSLSLSGSSQSWQRLNLSGFSSKKRKDNLNSTGLCSIK